MSNPAPSQPLSFGVPKKHITRKTNLIQVKNDFHLKNLKSESKNKKQNNRHFESTEKNQHFLPKQNKQSKERLSSEEKNDGWKALTKKQISQCTKTPNSNSVSLIQRFQHRQSSKETHKVAKKSLSKTKNITLFQLYKKVRKFSDNSNESLKIFEELKSEHVKEDMLMKMVLSEKELHRFRKILAVEEAECLMEVLKDKQANHL